MKLEHPPLDVESHNHEHTLKCRIIADAHTFDLLIRQYSNPIRAIVQEIGSNCIDGQRRVGKEKLPWKLTLPTRLDSHIRWRDYGASMDYDKIKNVYSIMGSSDKRESSDDLGYFGIGSKTPFAYTDSFIVSAYLDGTVTHYSIFRDKDRMPSINIMSSGPTDEENGLEVSFEVKDFDRSKFSKQVKDVYRFLDVKPDVVGEDIEFEEEVKTVEGKGWYFCENRKQAKVIFGGIGYNLSPEHVDSHLKQLVHKGVHLIVPVGSIFVTPSREALEYNDTTINYLNQALEEVNVAVQLELKKKVGEFKNSYQLSKKASEIKDATGFELDPKMYPGFNISAYWTLKNYDTKYQYSSQSRGISRKTTSFETDIYVSNALKKNFRVVINDLKTGFEKRIKSWINEQRDKGNNVTVYFYRNDDPNEPRVTPEYICNIFGCSQSEDDVVLFASELPDVSAKARVKKPAEFTVLKDGYYNTTKVVEDVNTGEYVYGKSYLGRWDFNHMREATEAFPEELKYIYMLQSRNERFAKYDNFINIVDWLPRKLAEIDTPEFQQEYADYFAFKEINHRGFYGKMYDLKMPLGKLHDLCKFCNKFTKEKTAEKLQNILDIGKIVKYNFKGNSKKSSLATFATEIENGYPMLQYMHNNTRYSWSSKCVDAAKHLVYVINNTPKFKVEKNDSRVAKK